MKTLLLLVLSMAAAARDATAQEDVQCVRDRAAMIETIKDYAQSRSPVLGQQGFSERVLEAMRQTKRHLFMFERSCSVAYADMPLPIGLGQTISQPFIVALMTQLAEVAPDHVVLEIGTGSGYLAALLAHKADDVVSVEIEPRLKAFGESNLRRAGVHNVRVKLADGARGLGDDAPYDVIVATGSLPLVPASLTDQLAVGGRLAVITGEEPAMVAQIITRVSEDGFDTLNLFETRVKPLRNADRPSSFRF